MLYTLNINTGVATVISSIEGFGVNEGSPTGLAFLPKNNLFFMIGSANNALYTLDITTGQATRVGNVENFGVAETSPTAIAYNSMDNILYMLGSDNNALFMLNQNTGEATRVGNVENFGLNLNEGIGLTYNSDNSFLYMSVKDSSLLYVIDQNTGEATQIGLNNLLRNSDENITGLTYGSQGILFGVGNDTNALYTLNDTTGQATRVGNVENFGVNEINPSGIVFDSNNDILYMVSNLLPEGFLDAFLEIFSFVLSANIPEHRFVRNARELKDYFRLFVSDPEFPGNGDDSDSLWTDFEIYTYMDWAQRDFARETDLFLDRLQITYNSDEFEFNILDYFSGGIVRLERAIIGGRAEPLELRTLRQLDDYSIIEDYGVDRGINWETETGVPRYIVMDTFRNIIRLVPIPDRTGTLTLHVVRYPAAGLNVFEIEDRRLQMIIIDQMCGYAYEKQDADVFNLELSSRFKSEFRRKTIEYKVELKKLEKPRRPILYGGIHFNRDYYYQNY